MLKNVPMFRKKCLQVKEIAKRKLAIRKAHAAIVLLHGEEVLEEEEYLQPAAAAPGVPDLHGTSTSSFIPHEIKFSVI